MTGKREALLRSLPAPVIDVVPAAAVAGAMVLTISVAEEEATRSPDLLAHGLGVTVGALLLMRRRAPLGVLIGSVGALFLYYGLDYPAFSPAVPLAVAAYSAVVAGHLIATAVLLTGIVLFGLGWQTLAEDAELASVLGANTLTDAALLAAVVLLGEAVRHRRAWAEEVRLRLQRADRDREREATRHVEQERLRIARDVHDVLAHTVAAINVQAGAAADALGDAPEEAERSLRAIREESRRAIAELTAAVGLLRGGDGDAPGAPAPGLRELGRLTDVAARAGVDVELSVAGPERAVPAAVELTAYRIVQESLTNVVRHAGATSATVALRFGGDSLMVLVEDDGRGADTAPNGDGHGLVGMRERAAAVGGTLDTGSTAGGGFRVTARLPLSAPAP